MDPGTKVIIRQNPHHHGAGDIVGTVVSYRSREGFSGCDMVDIRYVHPKTGKQYTMPFRSSCLERVTSAALINLAERYETIADELRGSIEALE